MLFKEFSIFLLLAAILFDRTVWAILVAGFYGEEHLGEIILNLGQQFRDVI